MADASVEAEVVELAQKVLAEHVHVWNGASHGTPNHRTVPDSTPQHRFANGGAKQDLRQRIHGAKVAYPLRQKLSSGTNRTVRSKVWPS